MPLDPEVQWQAWELEAKRLKKENTQLRQAIEEALDYIEDITKRFNYPHDTHTITILKKALAGKEGE